MKWHRETKQARREGRRIALRHSSAVKRQVFYALENVPRAKQPAKAFGIALFVLILLNAFFVFISVQPGLDPVTSTSLQIFYAFSTLCFCVEYLLRLWIADQAYGGSTPTRARLHYMISPLGIIDVLSFAPNMISWFLPVTPAVINAVNVMRLVRLVKISRYMRGLRTISRVLEKRYREIVASFLVIALMVIVSSVVMYEIENPVQPEKFNNLLSGVYWAVTTMTGTGYGDIVPVTPAGRIVGSIIMLLSVALMAIPGGIFSAGFVAEYQNADLRRIERGVHKVDVDEEKQGGTHKDVDEEKQGGTHRGL